MNMKKARNLKLNADQINDRIYQSKKDKIKIFPCNNLRASNLGHPCERYLYLLIKHWDEQLPHDVGLQNIFDLGNSIELHTIKNITDAGYEVFTPTQRSWKINNPLITGREDIRIKDENGELFPVEIKGLSPQEYSKLNCIADFFKSKKYYIRGYPAQLQIYMYYFSKEKGFFALTNKLTGETKFIEMPFDYEYAESLLQKAERIYKALDKCEPPDSCDDVSVCEYCSLQHICGKVKRIPADIELDDDLENLINRKQELSAAKREYDELNDEIKSRVGEREKIITGNYLITRNKVERKAYTVEARTEYRLQIKKL